MITGESGARAYQLSSPFASRDRIWGGTITRIETSDNLIRQVGLSRPVHSEVDASEHGFRS